MQDLALYSSFNGIVLVDKEGKEIAKALGNKKAALLQNHGLLTVADSIEAAVFWFVSLEKCCHAQLMADAAAGGRGSETIKIEDEDAAFTYKVSPFLAIPSQIPGGLPAATVLPPNIDVSSFFGDTADHIDLQTIGTPMAGWFSAKPMFDVVAKECNEDYLE